MKNKRKPSSVGVAKDHDKKKTEKNDPNYDMVSLSKKRNTKRQPSESLEEQDLTLNRSNAATCTENVIKKRRGRPPKALNVLNI